MAERRTPYVHEDDDLKVPDYTKEEITGEKALHVETAEDLVTQVIHVEDDPTERAITPRSIFLGVGLACFASVLQEIFYFKPQTVFVSLVFLTVIAYVLGDALALVIPRIGFLRHLNPGPFSKKEHAAVTIMASASAHSALATEALAAQELYYGGYPSTAAGIFIVISSQLIGFGIAGLLRSVIVHPTKMVWPMQLPVSTLLETLHGGNAKENKKKMKVWYIVFFALFFWTLLPEYMFPLLTGVSIFCLANQHNLVFTALFGGASGNEGLGFLSLGLDWTYISAFFSPWWYPLQTTVNMTIGICICYMLFMGIFYGNVWDSQKLPFLSQELYNATTSNGTYFEVYNQTKILTAANTIDFDMLKIVGTPSLTGTYLAALITSNVGTTATFVYMLLWNRDDLKNAWSWAKPSNLRKMWNTNGFRFWKTQEVTDDAFQRQQNDPDLDPHYKLMMRNGYKEVPLWWWGAILVGSWITGCACLYVMKSTLPWWGLLLATVFTFIFVLFFGAQFGLTGFGFNLQPICQMLAGYLFPGRPIANMYFTCYTYNCYSMACVLAKDLRLAQYSHLAPYTTFCLQVAGAGIGAIFNWVMMLTIVENRREILLSIEGTNVWSGQTIQSFNSLAIAWGIAPHMFSIGAKYQWVTISFLVGFLVPLPLWLAYKYTGKKAFGYLNPSIILWFAGNLYVGINSSFLTFFLIAYTAQFYVRRYKPELFVKYNYLISAAMDGGAQTMVFILTFAVAGGSGTAHPFPEWAGNPNLKYKNADLCMKNPYY